MKVTATSAAAFAVLVTPEKSWLLTDSRYTEAASQQVRESEVRKFTTGHPLSELVGTLLGGFRGTLAAEADRMSHAEWARWEQELRCTLHPAGALLNELRRSKDKDELHSMIEAQRIAEKALDDVLGILRPGLTEKEVAAELTYRMLRYGGEENSFDPIVVTGAKSSMPHGVPGDNVIQDGDFVTMDFGTKKDGYCSAFICYNHTILTFVNNTVVGNKNWAEYGGPYPGMNLRGGVASLFANNIMVANYTSPCTKEMEAPEYERQDNFLSMGGSHGTLANNLIEGNIKDKGNATVQGEINVALGFDLSSVLNSDYKPQGVALGAGTLSSITYKSGNAGFGPFTCDVKGLLEKYKVDLAGNPRITNGKVDLGCYQAQ